MSFVLFAIIGAKAGMGAFYWICYGLYCAFQVVKAVVEAVRENT